MNRSARSAAIPLILAAIGLVDSLYLVWVKISQNSALCIPGLGDCWSVNTSPYSQLYGIPVAAIGALGYALILILEWRLGGADAGESGLRYASFGLTIIGVLFSAYLTYLEIAVIRAICPFCVLSAIVMLLLFAYNLTRLGAGEES